MGLYFEVGGEVMTNKEKAYLTYKMIQQRKKQEAIKKDREIINYCMTHNRIQN